MTSPRSPRHAGPPWLAAGALLAGLALVLAASLGALSNVAAFSTGGTPGASPAARGTPVASPAASPGASPVAGTTSRDDQASEAINSITQRIVRDNPIIARAQGPTAGETVFDPYRILTTDQTSSLTGDANRLRAAGLPVLVYIRLSVNTQAQSQQFAQSLAEKAGLVESHPGAQDGLVILIGIPPGAPQKGTLAIAYGKNALPVNGLDAATVQQIETQDMLPRLKLGQVFGAAQYGLRRFNYVVAYTPYSFPHRSPTAKTVGHWLSVAAPPVALLSIALLVLTWFPAGERWRTATGTAGRRWLGRWWPAALAGALGAVVIPLSVYARDRIGIFAAAAMLVALLLDAWVTADRPVRRARRRIIVAGGTLPERVARRRARPAERPAEGGGTFE